MAKHNLVELEPALGTAPGLYYFYPEPNPALTEILIGSRLQFIVAEWTAKVMASYVARIAPRSKSGEMLGSVDANVFIGGYKNDRWVGEITVGVEYAMADEFGRSDYELEHGDFISSGGAYTVGGYDGSGDLRGALYEHLPAI